MIPEILYIFYLFSGLPLRPSDARNFHGHIIHYRRTGFFPRSRERHVHFNPPPTRSAQAAPVESFIRKGGLPIETFLRNGGAKLHHAAIYEVPSNKHYNDARSGHELDLRLRSLVERYYNADGKTTVKPPVMVSTALPTGKRNKPQQVNHIVKSPSTVLSHFLNVEMREFHEQPVQSTKIEQKHIPDPVHVRAHVQRRKKPGPTKLPTKSYPLGLQFLNKAPKRTGIPRLLLEKNTLPLVRIRNKPAAPSSTASTTTAALQPTSPMVPTTTPSVVVTKATTTAFVPKTTTPPSIVVTYPQADAETTTSLAAGLEADLGLGMSDPLFSISMDSLFSDPDLTSAIPHGSNHAHSHEVGAVHQDTSGTPASTSNHMHHNLPHSHHGTIQSNQASGSGHHHPAMDHSHGHGGHNGHSGHPNSQAAHSSVGTGQVQAQTSVDSSVDASANALDKMFVGMFNHHVQNEPGFKHLHKQEEIIPVNKDLSVVKVTPSPARINFEKTTVHAKPITKRGIHNIGGYVSRSPNAYIDNVLKLNVWETTPPPLVPRHSMRYHATTAPSVETQINRQRMSEYLSSKMSTSNSDIPSSSSAANSAPVQSPTTAPVKPVSISTPVNPSPKDVSQKDLVHLRGIHIMFSNGQQDTSGKIPTIHLTASVSEISSKNASTPSSPTPSTSAPIPTTQTASPKPPSSVVDKIVGTAVIRNGHLYLILYPFGEKKSLKLNFGSKVSQIPLPHNKPLSYTEAPVVVQETTKAVIKEAALPRAHALHASMPAMSHGMVMPKETIASEYQPPASNVKAVKEVEHRSTSTHGSDDHSSHGGHGHMHHHMMSATPSGHTTFNDTTIRNFLSPLNRFMSPWKTLNMSDVFPFPKRNATSRQTGGDDDNDLDVVTFIAQATDPFERIKSIMESIANTTLFKNNKNTSVSSEGNSTQTQPEAKFNFELKIQTATIDQTRDSKASTSTQQNNENNSEEMLYDTSTGTNSAKSVQPIVTKDVKSDQSSYFPDISQPQALGLMNEYLKEVSPTAGPSMEPVTSDFKHNTVEKIRPLTTKAPEQDKTTTSESVSKDIVINTETNEPVNPNSEAPVTEGISNEDKDKPTLPGGSEGTTPPFSAKTTSTTQSILSKTLVPPQSTIGEFIPYRVYNETHPTSHQKSVTDTPQFNYSDNKNYPPFSKSRSRIVPGGKLSTGSNIQPVATGNQRLTRGQAEQVMSLSDILNDIRRIQLHNMHKFNIQNNNFNNLIVSEASRQNKMRTPVVVDGPLFQETSTRRFSSRPAPRQRQRPVTASSIQTQLLEQRQNALNDALDAMLVLSVDDILADHTTLHGAIVMSQRQRDQSSSNR